ncbi:MAG: serine/threonine-protein kinase [bacterium]|nr:serine/threonine-protein kinase [bacterium]
MATIGSIIENKYEVLKLIGQGGMSKVYLVMDIRLNKQWAIKEINDRVEDKDFLLSSLAEEVKLLKKLDHPALPRIIEVIEKEDLLYVVMDYVEGEPLSKIINHFGPQPQTLVIEWAKQLCGVLHYLHTRNPAIIYRDMKPDNIMLKPDGNLKLIDFGIAREYKEKHSSDTVSLGTKGYAAPEQFGGHGQTDPRTDIYCLGVTLYHLVTGKSPSEPPYEIYPIRHWNSNLSGGLEQIISKCTQANPKERYQNCMELYYALCNYTKIDMEHIKHQKIKIRIFVCISIASILLGLTGIGSYLLMKHEENKNYDTILLREEATSDQETAKKLLLSAIEICPNNTEAYLHLVDLYKEDTVFSQDEEEQLLSLLSGNLDSIKKQKDYNMLAFQIGKMYWYYYDYGQTNENDNKITRMKSSIRWFEDVLRYSDQSFEQYNMAAVYQSIGKFNRDITLNIEEANDQGSYAPYFKDLNELMSLVQTSNEESEIVKLELYSIITSSIEVYARKFKIDGVAKNEVFNMYNSILEKAKQTEAMTEKTEDIKKYILGREKDVRMILESTYATK